MTKTLSGSAACCKVCARPRPCPARSRPVPATPAPQVLALPGAHVYLKMAGECIPASSCLLLRRQRHRPGHFWARAGRPRPRPSPGSSGGCEHALHTASFGISRSLAGPLELASGRGRHLVTCRCCCRARAGFRPRAGPGKTCSKIALAFRPPMCGRSSHRVWLCRRCASSSVRAQSWRSQGRNCWWSPAFARRWSECYPSRPHPVRPAHWPALPSADSLPAHVQGGAPAVAPALPCCQALPLASGRRSGAEQSPAGRCGCPERCTQFGVCADPLTGPMCCRPASCHHLHLLGQCSR